MKAFNMAATLGLTVLTALGLAQDVMVDGKKVNFDAPPRMVNGTLMVPARQLFDAMGVEMNWRSDRQVIEGLRKGSKVELGLGNRQGRVNDGRRDMDQAPFVWKGRTYVPLKYVADAFGFIVSTQHGNFMLQEKKI